MAVRWLRFGTVAAICFLVAGVDLAAAEDKLVKVFGAPIATSELATQVESGEVWSSSVSCADAHRKVHGDPSKYPARERYAAVLELQGCVRHLEATLAAQVTDPDSARAADMSLRAESYNLEVQAAAAAAETNFMGVSFGVGVGISVSDGEIVSQAEVGPDNTIVGLKTETQLPRVVLESHYYDFCKTKSCNAGKFGIGPYFAIVAKSEKLLSAFSAGLMFGWRDRKPQSSGGFSIGVGALLDGEVKSLASGFEVGEPLPDGETEIRYETKSRWSAVIFFTRTF
jgi:hypothetical protein